MDKANELMAALESLEEVLGGRLWNRADDGFPYRELKEFLENMDVSGHVRMVKAASAGQPRAKWHIWARRFCIWVKTALKEAGYVGNLNEHDKNSVVAFIGACMIKDVLKQPGEANAETFASAMSGHRESRAKNPAPFFPDFNRLRTLD